MLAVCGGKGGCGKTTTTLGLLRELARQGPVLAVDADRDMPDLAPLAGVPLAPTLGDLDDGTGIRDLARPLPDRPTGAVVPAAPGDDREDLRRVLRRAAASGGPTLVDCPAGAGPAAVTPVRVADRALVVTTTAPPSLRDAAKTASLARAVGTPVAGAVLTGADEVHDGIRRLLGTRVTPVPRALDPVAAPEVRRARRRLVDRLW
ncbi:CDP-4-keto-6-deoxy-D-glucose-3-dehydrase [Halobacteriales archaeon QS_8_69_26]|nr:MAG: CDP-4-keto-6-deoxy-D-glucose-3-dehydrase [Halobacteriales archaeon QS_8_69_26]